MTEVVDEKVIHSSMNESDNCKDSSSAIENGTSNMAIETSDTNEDVGPESVSSPKKNNVEQSDTVKTGTIKVKDNESLFDTLLPSVKTENADDKASEVSNGNGPLEFIPVKTELSETNVEAENISPTKNRTENTKPVPSDKKKKESVKGGAALPTDKTTLKPLHFDSTEHVPDGWRRMLSYRMGGLSAGKYDVYYFSPCGKKLRSRNEIRTWAEKNNIAVNLTDFVFSHKPTANSPLMPIVSPLKSTGNSKVNSPKKRKILGPKSVLQNKKKKLSLGSEENENNCKESESLEKEETKVKNVAGKQKSNKKNQDEELMPRPKGANFKIKTSSLMKGKLKSSGNWVPPTSPFNLLQETLYHDPWKMLIGTLFTSKSTSTEIMNATWEFLERWSSPQAVIKADISTITKVLKPLDDPQRKAKTVKKFSEEYLRKNWQYPKELHGIGKYGNDSYRVFCVNEWKQVKPVDHMLNFYVSWLWDNHIALNID